MGITLWRCVLTSSLLRTSKGWLVLALRTAGLGVAVVLAGLGGAVETRIVRDSNMAQFAQGETTGIEVLGNGRLRLAPTLERLDRTSESITWSIAADISTTTLYFSTGHSGKVFVRHGEGPVEVFADLEEPQALSLALDPTGGVFVGTAPSGKIYRIREKGKPELFFETGEKYVWSLKMDPSGALLAGSGPKGTLWRIWGQGNGGALFKSAGGNVMDLLLDGEGRPVLGLQGKAAVVRVDGEEKGYVLWSGTEDEVRGLAQNRRTGMIFAGVNAAKASGLADLTSNKDGSGPPAGGVASVPPERPANAGIREMGGPGGTPGGAGPRGQGSGALVVSIAANGFATILWNAPEGPIHALEFEEESQTLLVAAGAKGRVWRVGLDGSSSIVADSDETMITAMVQVEGKLILGTANQAGIEVLRTNGPRKGTLMSRAFNAASTVRWGNVLVDLDPSLGTSLTLLLRTGNTPEPSARTWTDFTTASLIEPGRPGMLLFQSGGPVAQYFQYQLVLESDGDGPSPLVDGVQAFFLPQNTAPVIRDIDFVRGADVLAGAGGGGGGGGAPARSPQTTSAGRPSPGAASSGGSPSPEVLAAMGGRGGAPRPPGGAGEPPPTERPGGMNAVVTENPRRVMANWDAMDPNGDKLVYQVEIKAEDEVAWRILERDYDRTNLVLATDTLPDGRYRLRITAGDRLSNTPDSALETVEVSRILTVDNTPPRLENLRGERQPDGRILVRGLARDEASPLSAGDFTVDSTLEPRLFLPADGLFDGLEEELEFFVTPAEPRSEHIITLRIYDREGNSAVGRIVVR